MRIVLLFVAGLISLGIQAQGIEKAKIDKLADAYFLTGIEKLKDFLRLPNYGGNPDNIDLNVKWCLEEFQSLGFHTQLLTQEGVKHVFASRTYSENSPTILFYLQVDGQPVDFSEWLQESPYVPVLKECSGDKCTLLSWETLTASFDPNWKLFARSASDSKGPAVAFIQSLHILQDKSIPSEVNIKVIMDFQEELGSPKLSALVKSNRELFAADAMLIMDGTRPPGNLPTLTFGARGIATLKLTAYGAKKNLHSGQYGNYAPNPVFDLARILASMKDAEGKVLVKGFYDGVALSEATKTIINAVPENKEELLKDLGIAAPETIGATYQEALQYPSLNVRGLNAGWVGNEVRTIIPSKAIAEIDMRLVTETPAKRQIQLVRNHIEALGYHILDHPPTPEERASYSKLIRMDSRIGSLPFKTAIDSPLGAWLGRSMKHVFGEGNYVRMQATGGSQPIAPFISTLGIPALSVRIPNPDNSIHAPNENLRLGNFHEGLKMCLSILTQKYE